VQVFVKKCNKKLASIKKVRTFAVRLFSKRVRNVTKKHAEAKAKKFFEYIERQDNN